MGLDISRYRDTSTTGRESKNTIQAELVEELFSKFSHNGTNISKEDFINLVCSIIINKVKITLNKSTVNETQVLTELRKSIENGTIDTTKPETLARLYNKAIIVISSQKGSTTEN